MLKDYFLEIVSPDGESGIHSLPQETNQMIKFCMIYEFALIGRSEEAINIHVDTIRAYAIYFSRIVAAPRYEAVRGLVAARHLVLASTLTHPGRCVIYCAFVLQTLGSCVCASESFRFRFRIPASPVKQASTFTSCTFQDQLFSSCSVMPSAVCCSSRSHANERKRL